ncbi:MAG: hypothetical protein N2441_02370 [Rhodocyclaceae bacterium]|nr:hypothetical protein [Rhodocyclaceae bacterium]
MLIKPARALWFVIGFVGVEGFLILNFILTPRLTPFAREDFFWHWAAFAGMCLWFLVACQTKREKALIIASFFFLAILAEGLQTQSPYHVFDGLDLFANVLGVAMSAGMERMPWLDGLKSCLGVTRGTTAKTRARQGL